MSPNEPLAATTVLDSIQSATTPRIPFSVEFFPPREPADEERLWRAAREFERLGAAFASVTYGAGGKTRDRTVRITGDFLEETTLLPVAHLTAVAHSIADLKALCGLYADRGVRNLLVLRGDPPGNPLGDWQAHPEGVRYAEEVVRLVRDMGDFCVGIASFPEGHFRAESLEADTFYTLQKLRAGAEYSITQIFFDVEDYLRLRDRLATADPEHGAKPVIPSLMPITSLKSIKRMVELSGSTFPAHLERRFEQVAGPGGENADAVRKLGTELSTEMAERLIAEGAPSLHFNTLNFVRATHEVLGNLGLAPAYRAPADTYVEGARISL